MTDVQNIVEETVDVVEETLDTIERIPNLNLNGTTKKQQIIILGATAVVSALVAGTVSHFVTRKFLTTKFDKITAEEVEKAKHFFARTNKLNTDGTPLTPQDVFEGLQVDEATAAMLNYQGKGHVITAEPPVATEEELAEGTFHASEDGTLMIEDNPHNVFNGREPVEDDWDIVEEVANRTPQLPYIISHDEFYENNPEFEQDELTFYEGDQQLADTQGVLVDNPVVTVGEDNLKFGHGSLDANTVFIRNEKLRCDFEVTKSTGKYAHEVMGLDMEEQQSRELRHSMRRPLKMRSTDG